jgi:hypothetical protein
MLANWKAGLQAIAMIAGSLGFLAFTQWLLPRVLP